MMVCYICGVDKDLRPYGLNGAPICFDCMKSSSELEEEAKRQFGTKLDKSASKTGAAMIGSDLGPIPIILPKT